MCVPSIGWPLSRRTHLPTLGGIGGQERAHGIFCEESASYRQLPEEIAISSQSHVRSTQPVPERLVPEPFPPADPVRMLEQKAV